MDKKALLERFYEIYGRNGEKVRMFFAPGRVNLIGEHTDYNGGYVFPAALTMGSTVLARPRADRQINLIATDLNILVNASLDNLEEYKSLKWGNYQLGVAFELQKAGYELVGCDLMYYDTVPLKSGLSSSAAIEVATAVALIALGSEAPDEKAEPDMVEIAKICRQAENSYVGVNCGIMDQFASAMGRKDHAIFLDCKNLKYEMVPINLDGYKIVISNTNKSRSLAASKYNERRSECEKALLDLQAAIPGITCLADVTPAQFEEFSKVITDETVRKRAAHVIYENHRVIRAVNTLKNNDLAGFGKLMDESHLSLKELYEVTGSELDIMVEEAHKVEGVLGSRMTGAGFGGCTVSIVAAENVDTFKGKVYENYRKRTGIDPSFYVSDIGDGGREIIIADTDV